MWSNLAFANWIVKKAHIISNEIAKKKEMIFVVIFMTFFFIFFPNSYLTEHLWAISSKYILKVNIENTKKGVKYVQS